MGDGVTGCQGLRENDTLTPLASAGAQRVLTATAGSTHRERSELSPAVTQSRRSSPPQSARSKGGPASRPPSGRERRALRRPRRAAPRSHASLAASVQNRERSSPYLA